jgi:hypothetical protein
MGNSPPRNLIVEFNVVNARSSLETEVSLDTGRLAPQAGLLPLARAIW